MSAITTVSGTLTIDGPGAVDFPDLATQGGFIMLQRMLVHL